MPEDLGFPVAAAGHLFSEALEWFSPTGTGLAGRKAVRKWNRALAPRICNSIVGEAREQGINNTMTNGSESCAGALAGIGGDRERERRLAERRIAIRHEDARPGCMAAARAKYGVNLPLFLVTDIRSNRGEGSAKVSTSNKAAALNQGAGVCLSSTNR
jgi:hypothetical protein